MSDTYSGQPSPRPLRAAADGTEPAQAMLGPTDASTYGLAVSDLLAALTCGIGRSYDRHQRCWRKTAPVCAGCLQFRFTGSRTLECPHTAAAAAHVLMCLVDEGGARAGKYAVDVRGAQGVQIGDRNTQDNVFPARRAG